MNFLKCTKEREHYPCKKSDLLLLFITCLHQEKDRQKVGASLGFFVEIVLCVCVQLVAPFTILFVD